MSLDYFVHFERQRSVTLSQWREKIIALGYPLVLPDTVDPSAPEGVTDCTYENEAVVLGFFLDENPELPSPFAGKSQSFLMQFNFSASAGERTNLAAVAAAASFCIATGGVINDDSELIRASKAKAWARSLLKEDDAMTKLALKFAHPDRVPVVEVKGPSESWWKWWRRT
ncbi:MAG: hypothetical protein ABI821_20955 [Pseudomonadota bacterium]